MQPFIVLYENGGKKRCIIPALHKKRERMVYPGKGSVV
jgi:hypothetical protein